MERETKEYPQQNKRLGVRSSVEKVAQGLKMLCGTRGSGGRPSEEQESEELDS
jgi:hypothetical protein